MNILPSIDAAKQSNTITHFLTTTMQSAGFNTALIALSGGIDSATATMLTAKTIDPTHVHVLMMPSRQTDPVHIEHSLELAHKAKLPDDNIHTINIASIIQKTWRIIKSYEEVDMLASGLQSERAQRNRSAQPEPGVRARESAKQSPSTSNNRLRLANLAARIRMMVLYDQAKKLNALVIGTENRSEQLLGYFTRFGDEASDIEPIKHLYKTQVRELARYLEIPQAILDKAPTAGLWRGQTDESELGFSYHQADSILYLAYDQKLSAEEIYKKHPEFSKSLIKNVLSTSYKNLFKHQVPYALDTNGV